MPDWLRTAALILAGAYLLGLLSSQAEDTDIWWHLKTGQYIFEHRALPVPDPFAYTTALNPPANAGEAQVRRFNLTHEWLAQTIFYALYAIGGIPAVILLRAVMLAAFCAMAGLLAARRSADFYFGIGAALAASSLAVDFTSDRPLVFTFFFVAVFITVLELRRFLWLLPVLASIWGNCHGGYFLGWVVLLAYCAETIPLGSRLSFLGSRWTQPADRRRLYLVTICAIAASALNPNGFGAVATLVHYRQGAQIPNLVEWHPPYLWGPPYAFDVLLYASALIVLLSWRKLRLAEWLLFLAFAAASLLAFRNILLIGFLGPVLIAGYFPWRFRLPRAVVAWGAPVLLVGGLTMGFARGWFFQLHAAMWKFPAGAADYLLANNVPGPLFNTWEHGGYLIWRLWPRQRVFIDGRVLSEAANRDYRQILYNMDSAVDQVVGPRADLLKRYGIQAVVMNTFEYNSGAAYPLALALAGTSGAEWQLVYDDSQTLIFWRNPPPGIPAFADKVTHVLNHMDTECSAAIENDPVAPLCARTLADLWMRSRQNARARNMLMLYLAHATQRDLPAERALQQLGGAAPAR